MKKNLILTVDSSTSSTTVIAWDTEGNLIYKISKKIKMFSPETGFFEQNAEDWVKSLVENFRKIKIKFEYSKILCISITHQRETFVPVNSQGKILRPAITWLDERCKKEVTTFSKKVGTKKMLRITGKNIDIIPTVYKIEWIKKNEKEIFKKTFKFLDVQSFLIKFLCNKYRTSWASADSSGIFDVKNKSWSKIILKKLGLKEKNFPETFKPGTIVGNLTKTVAKLTGLESGIPIMVGGGDGQSAFMGTVVETKNSAFLNLGTSVNAGVFCKKYFYDTSCKTSLSFDNKGYILENPIKAGTFSIDWYLNNILKLKDKQKYKNIEKNIQHSSIKNTGLFFLPYLLGVMGPYWDSDAKGILLGLTGNTTREDIYRSIKESIVLEQIFTLKIILKKINKKINKIIVIGGGASSNTWCQMFANISGLKIIRPQNTEGTSLGLVILSLTHLGYFKSTLNASKLILGKQKIKIFFPNKKEIFFSKKLINLYSKIYPQNKKLFSEIKKFKDSIKNEK